MDGFAAELEQKVLRVRRWLAHQDTYEAVCLGHPINFAWITGGGRNMVARTSESGAAHVLVTRDDAVIVTSNIEAERISREENPFGLNVVAYDWWQGQGLQRVIEQYVDSSRLVTDIAMPFGHLGPDALFMEFRRVLTEQEQMRARSLGREAAEALEHALLDVRPEWSEQDLAWHVETALFRAAIDPAMVLVGGEERIYRYRHPVPTGAPVGALAMVAVGARRAGLVMSLSRLISWGRPDEEVVRRLEATAGVLEAMVARTVAGASYRAIWDSMDKTYRDFGYPDGWQGHHQGGLTGYRSREWRLTPSLEGTVRPGELYAWNPSLPGAKAEHTLLVTPNGPEILTQGPVYVSSNPAWVAPNLVDVSALS
ncbi:MAG: M24 family metallopeptidase [Firmicutes bacterium]|nr:M24 family metallopeptidase [Bacillota bacterium]